MITFPPYPIPVVTPIKGADGKFIEGYVLYVTASPYWENDQFCVVMDDTRILHFSTNQLRVAPNGTYEIAPPKPDLDKVVRDTAECLGVDPKLIRPPSTVAAVSQRMALRRKTDPK